MPVAPPPRPRSRPTAGRRRAVTATAAALAAFFLPPTGEEKNQDECQHCTGIANRSHMHTCCGRCVRCRRRCRRSPPHRPAAPTQRQRMRRAGRLCPGPDPRRRRLEHVSARAMRVGDDVYGSAGAWERGVGWGGEGGHLLDRDVPVVVVVPDVHACQ